MARPDPLLLDRFAIRPRHEDAFWPLWRRAVALREGHGATMVRCFVETDAEPKLSWLYRQPGGLDQLAVVEADEQWQELAGLMAPHVFRNRVVREVRPEVLTTASPQGIAGTHGERIAIMRRYAITGGWDGFLDVWRRIVPVREKHGFRCLFAVADEPHDLFTWAFDLDGSFDGFAAAQRDYYHDPQRVALREVFDFMADYSIHPARQVLFPAQHPTPEAP